MFALAIPTAGTAAAAAAAGAQEDDLEMQILVSLTLLDEKVKDIPTEVAHAYMDSDMYSNEQDEDWVDVVVSSGAREPDPAVRLHQLTKSDVLVVNLILACNVQVRTVELVVKLEEAHLVHFFDVWAFGPSERRS